MSTIQVRVITPEGIYKEFETPYLNFQTTDGDRGILPNHMPIVSSLKIGKMSSEENGVRNLYAVAGGLLYFHDNHAEILTDAIENKDDIDVERAKASKERAEKRLTRTDRNTDMKRAELALKRSINRLTVAGM